VGQKVGKKREAGLQKMKMNEAHVSSKLMASFRIKSKPNAAECVYSLENKSEDDGYQPSILNDIK